VPGPRVYTLDEANDLVPALAEAFGRIDELRKKLRMLKIKLNALEMLWGGELEDVNNPDHTEGKALLDQLGETENAVAAVVQDIGEFGGLVKDVHGGLVDVYHVREGILVHLCWQRGEEEFIAWHDVDAGFADRESL